MKINKSPLYMFLLLILSLNFTSALFPSEKTPKSKMNLRTGLFFSLGPSNYSSFGYKDDQMEDTVKDPSDLFVGASMIIRDMFEINLVYNRTTEITFSEPGLPVYDKDGLGLETGINLPIHLFKKNNFDVFVEFTGGVYGMVYLFKRQSGGLDANIFPGASEVPLGEDKSTHYQLGFYWGVRMRYLISGKASIEIGYKTMLPSNSNEFLERRGSKVTYNKSFLTIGVSF